MQNELVNKYLSSKRETLLSYAVTLYKVYEIEDEKLWKDEKEFKDLMDNILKIYIGKYYLRDETDFKKLNKNNLSEKDFNITLSLAVISDYFGNEYNDIKIKYKKSIYNLTLILYIVTNADKKISFYNKYNVTSKNIIFLLNKLFSDLIGEKEISKNPFVLEMLANKIKDSEKKEIRFFESLKDSESYINFVEYQQGSYYVDYNYDLNSLTKYEITDVETIYKRYDFKNQFLNISYDLSIIQILKLFSNNCVVPEILLPISSSYLKNKKNINYIEKIFSNHYIKDKIAFSTRFNDYKNNLENYLKLDELGFKLVLFLDKTDIIVDYSKVKFDYEFYITNEFLELNPTFIKFAEKGSVNYKVINNLKTYNEDELMHICVEKES